MFKVEYFCLPASFSFNGGTNAKLETFLDEATI
jgi:hypothetical protein